MSEAKIPALKFTDLPAELVVCIILLAQTAWQEEHFSAQAPYAEVKRYAVTQPAPASSIVPPCCSGVRWDLTRPSCIKLSGLPSCLPSPAHSVSQVSRRLRDILLEENSAIWRLDNALYPAIAKRSGERRTISNGRTTIEYNANSLVALDVCTCVLRGLRSFYSGLERVKLRLPWSGDGTVESELQHFLWANRGGADGSLRHMDVEALDADPLRVAFGRRRRMEAIEIPELLTSRQSGGNRYHYSETLIALYLHQGPDADVVFGLSLSIGLFACTGTIQFLTIDIAAGFVAEIQGSLIFPKLRYFRLCTHPTSAAILLRSMVLPYAIDLHLEPVDSWREFFEAKHPGVYEVPFRSSQHSPALFQTAGRRPQDFAQSLARPHHTSSIHGAPAVNYSFVAGDPADALWQRSTAVMGLDVRIDPDTKSRQPAAARFPELVSITLAESVGELRPVLEDPVGRDAGRSRELADKVAARRSLTFRDGEFFGSNRARHFNSQYPKALYDTLQYALSVVLGPSSNGPAYSAQEFVFAKDSWLPDRSLGYQHILQPFTALRALHFDSPALPEGLKFRQNMEGCFTSEHMHALTLCLNIPGAGGVYICPQLQAVHLQIPSRRLLSWAGSPGDWDAALNSPARLASGARRVALYTI
ncbi:unnamed protein product [Peniophora sp. CBMAI 1063]|nr:unnamed protein product [Peniophora sp. CBMAI 1063]